VVLLVDHDDVVDFRKLIRVFAGARRPQRRGADGHRGRDQKNQYWCDEASEHKTLLLFDLSSQQPRMLSTRPLPLSHLAVNKRWQSGDMRLNAWLARAGVASRRGADDLIKDGRVTVNGAPGQLNTFVQARDRVELDGRRLELQKLSYVLLHKPVGVVATASD